MQSLNIFINESLSNKQKELIGKLFSTMFKDTKINKEQIGIILNTMVSKDMLQKKVFQFNYK